MGETFVIKRIELKKILSNFNVPERNIADIENTFKKSHRHLNAVVLAGALQKAGLKQADVYNVLRRVGLDDLKITEILNTLDEQKINETFGRVVELSIE